MITTLGLFSLFNVKLSDDFHVHRGVTNAFCKI